MMQDGLAFVSDRQVDPGIGVSPGRSVDGIGVFVGLHAGVRFVQEGGRGRTGDAPQVGQRIRARTHDQLIVKGIVLECGDPMAMGAAAEERLVRRGAAIPDVHGPIRTGRGEDVGFVGIVIQVDDRGGRTMCEKG